MAKDYIEYLAVNVLNEGRTVTYRSLSRALKVHSNLAKQMLYDFHISQIRKRPGSVHATYLLTGRQRVPKQPLSQTNGIQEEDGGNAHMQSSPLPASSAPETQEDGQEGLFWIKLMTLAKEEQLDDAKAKFDELLSIHLYSLEQGTINDLETLTECNRSIALDFASEDPLEIWKQYGIIQNANVKRRTARRPPPVAASAPASISTKPITPLMTKKDTAKATTKDTRVAVPPENASAKSTPETEQKSAVSSKKATTAKPPTIKREVSSIFKSFAKANPKAPEQDTEDSAHPSPAGTPAETTAEDDIMAGLSDEEAGDDDAAMLDEGALDAPADTAGRSRKERKEELRAMMEVDDEPMSDAPITSLESLPATDKKDASAKEESEPESAETVTVTNGRRRGRRRIMKKKTVKDEEGYLVTREEAAWESFSEDEPAPKRPKTSTPAPAAAKGKKGSKIGQGNIMSFFKKT
ncbi:DNA polymerase subunit Cdc27 [Delphinella strobiligena]|nr:DNA polymerase subunit Cdc27 [Delphinella strobiligena]